MRCKCHFILFGRSHEPIGMHKNKRFTQCNPFVVVRLFHSPSLPLRVAVKTRKAVCLAIPSILALFWQVSIWYNKQFDLKTYPISITYSLIIIVCLKSEVLSMVLCKLVEEDHNISNSIIINLCMYDNSMTLYLLYTISQQAFNKVT